MFKSLFSKFQAICGVETKFFKYGRIGVGCSLGGYLLYRDKKMYQNSGSECESAVIDRDDHTSIDATEMMNELMNSVRLELGSTVKFRITYMDTSFYQGLFRPQLVEIGLLSHVFSKNPDDLKKFLKFVHNLPISYQGSENIKAVVQANVDLVDFELHRAIFKANDRWTIPDYLNVIPFFLPHPLSVVGFYFAGGGLLLSRSREYQADQYAAQKLTPDQLQKVIDALNTYQVYFEGKKNIVIQGLDSMSCPSFFARSQHLKNSMKPIQ